MPNAELHHVKWQRAHTTPTEKLFNGTRGAVHANGISNSSTIFKRTESEEYYNTKLNTIPHHPSSSTHEKTWTHRREQRMKKKTQPSELSCSNVCWEKQKTAEGTHANVLLYVGAEVEVSHLSLVSVCFFAYACCAFDCWCLSFGVFLCVRACFPLIFHSLLDFHIQTLCIMPTVCAIRHSAPTIDLLIIAAFYSRFLFSPRASYSACMAHAKDQQKHTVTLMYRVKRV